MILNAMDILFFVARLLLAGVFGIAGLSKLADRAGSRQALLDFGVPASLATPFGLALPVVELVVAVMLIPTASSWWGSLAALLLLVLFIVGISANLAQGRKPACHCFGQLDSEPIGWHTLVRNGLLAAMAVSVLFQEWIVLRLGGVDASLVAVSAIAAVAISVQGWLLYRLYRRLVALETRLAEAGVVLSRKGLPVGAPAPAFKMTGLTGETVTLDQLRGAGKPVLLVFTELSCGHCKKLLPTLGRWQREHASQLAIVNVTLGSVEANRANAEQYGIRNVLIQKGVEVQQAYRVTATPCAVVVRSDGKIGSTMAIGEVQIGALIQNTLDGRGNEQPLERALTAVRERLTLNWGRQSAVNR